MMEIGYFRVADEFLTPLSTPPDEEDFEKIITAAAFSYETEDMEALKGRFYERYSKEDILLSQMLVRKVV